MLESLRFLNQAWSNGIVSKLTLVFLGRGSAGCSYVLVDCTQELFDYLSKERHGIASTIL